MTQASLKTLFTFLGSDGASPSGLVEDAAGNIYGATSAGGANGTGTVFELAAGSQAPTTLVSNGTGGGAFAQSSLAIDSAGDLFGTTSGFVSIFGHPGTPSTLFEVVAGSDTLTTVTPLTGGFLSQVAVTANGDIYGVENSGAAGSQADVSQTNAVFEVAAGSGQETGVMSYYAAGNMSPTGLVVAADGNLYGVTQNFGPTNFQTNGTAGTVYEIALDGGGGPTALHTFTGDANGGNPIALAADSAGDLFGTTRTGGAHGDGTIFEIAAGTHAFSTLVSFSAATGSAVGALLVDGVGDVFGTTSNGGANGDGSVFELAAGSGAITTVASFDSSDAGAVKGSLVVDSSGNLYGTTVNGGASGDGTLFEVSNSGYVAAPAIALAKSPVASNVQSAALGTVTAPHGDAVTVAITSDPKMGTASGLELVNGTLYYSASEPVTAADLGPDPIKYTLTDTVTGAVTAETQVVTLNDGPAPAVKLAANPVAGNGTPATLGAAIPYYGPGLTVKLTSDADFKTGSSVTLSASNALIYTAGHVTAANAGPDKITYTITDNTTGAVTTETQTVTLNAGPYVTLTANPAATNSSPAVLGTVQEAEPNVAVHLVKDSSFATGSAVSISNTGTLIYTPGLVTPAKAGSDTITYTVTDTITGISNTETQTVTLGNDNVTVKPSSSVLVSDLQSPVTVWHASQSSGPQTITTSQQSFVVLNATIAGDSFTLPAGTIIAAALSFDVTAQAGIITTTLAAPPLGFGSDPSILVSGTAAANASTTSATSGNSAPQLGSLIETVAVNDGTAHVTVDLTASQLAALKAVGAGGSYFFSLQLAEGGGFQSGAMKNNFSSETISNLQLNLDVATPPLVILGKAPAASNAQAATLGTAAPGVAGDPLSVKLTGDSVFGIAQNSGSSIALHGTSLVYTPGVIMTSNAGTDTVSYTVTDTVTGATTTERQSVTLAAPSTTLTGPAYGNATITQTPGVTNIIANGFYNIINAHAGAATIEAGAGDATVNGGDNALGVVFGGYGNAFTAGNGNDSAVGSQGNSSVHLGNGNDQVGMGGYGNSIVLGNGTDSVAAGAGNAVVSAGSGNDLIVLGGYTNIVTAGGGNDTVSGGQGSDTITLGNGADSVTESGSGNTITVGSGNDSIVAGSGNDTVHTGAGTDVIALAGGGNIVTSTGGSTTIWGADSSGSNTVSLTGKTETIDLGGQGNSITVHGQTNSINAGSGGDKVTSGAGNTSVVLAGSNNSVTLGAGTNSVSGGNGNDTIHLSGGNATLMLSGTGNAVFLGGSSASITDMSSQSTLSVTANGLDIIQNFGADRGNVIDLIGGAGGYHAAAAAYASLTNDGHGGSILMLGPNAHIDFAGVAPQTLSAANFKIG